VRQGKMGLAFIRARQFAEDALQVLANGGRADGPGALNNLAFSSQRLIPEACAQVLRKFS